ncbi:hypothetical protein ATO10_15682 [Actibacterium atlanticum]|uniref:Lipoprotein n=1 Tax=Actibacterium atlanticum TaxID=1461693 RepID=A0A058ZGI8_9RHOB|nr:hypothetical protein [Actibacterium atlanticum]KCV80739.1 hypothetical protein ATO10_15682 [Actibacterium atlanticum]
MRISKLFQGAFALGLAATLAGCAGDTSLEGPAVPLGDFKLGYAIVVTENAQKIGPSREASPDEWKELLTRDLEQRFGRYDGDKFYHIAVNLDGYALAVPGIPVVLSPKSATVVSVTIWDDAAGGKINEEPNQITVLESLSGGTILGSGYTKSREEQMANLSRNTAKLIEDWIVENRLEWFGEDGTGLAKLRTGAAPESEGPVLDDALEATDGAADTTSDN